MKALALPASVVACLLLCLPPTAQALPSRDPALHKQVNVQGEGYQLLRDADELYQWYYVPPKIRLATDEGGAPQVRIITYVAEGQRNAIVQAQVTARAPEAHLQTLREAAADWYRGRPDIKAELRPSPDRIQIAPVGPIRLSTVRLIQFQQKGDTFSIQPLWDSSFNASGALFLRDEDAADAPASLDDEEPERKDAFKAYEGVTEDGIAVSYQPPTEQLRGRGFVIDSGGYLTQNSWIQFEVEGIGVDIYEELLRGRSGGLVLVMRGLYDTLSVPANVKVQLDVEAASSYFREKSTRSSGWRFLCFGGRHKKTRDYIRTSKSLNESLTITGTRTSELSDEQWDAISNRLVTWVTGQVFDVRPAPADGQVDSVSMPTPTIDIGAFSTLFGLPPLSGLGLKVGFGSSSGNFIIDIKQNLRGTRKAEWNERQVVAETLNLAGAVSLGHFDEDDLDGVITQLDIKPLPRLTVTTPHFGASPLQRVLEGSTLVLSRENGGTYRWKYDANEKTWHYLGSPSELNIPTTEQTKLFTNHLMVVLNHGADPSKAQVRLLLSRLNPHVPNQGSLIDLDKKSVLEARSSSDGTVDLNGEAFPFSILTVDPSAIPFGTEPGQIRSLSVFFGLGESEFTSARSLSQGRPLVLPAFDARNREPQTVLHPGQIEGLLITADFLDPLAQGTGKHTWEADPSDLLGLKAGQGYLSLTPDLLGLRRYRIERRNLERDFPDGRDFTLEVHGENGGLLPLYGRIAEMEDVLEIHTRQKIQKVVLIVDSINGRRKFLLKEDDLNRLRASLQPISLSSQMFIELDDQNERAATPNLASTSGQEGR